MSDDAFWDSFRQQESSHDFHSQYAFQGQSPQLAIIDPDSVDYTGWHEMDFTTTPLTSSRIGPDSQKYSAAMDRHQDSLVSLPSSNHRHGSAGSLINSSSHQQTSGLRRASGDIYASNQYSFSQLLDMEASLSPMDQPSLNSSRADDDSNMTNNDNGLTTTLSASDSINASPPMNNLDPIAISIATRPDSTEKLCPLIAGQVDSCQPSRCGPDAPCMNFTTLPPIEECTSVPCITGSTSLDETMVSNDSMFIELRHRPTMSTRTNSTTTPRSSTTRRSSSSTTATTTTDNPSTASPPTAQITHDVPSNPRKQQTPPHHHSALLRQQLRRRIPTPARQTHRPSKADAKQRAKQAHSLVERKYRENLNSKITQLHSTLQNSHYGPRFGEDNERDDAASVSAANNGGLPLPPSKVRKSDVLTEAMNYVNQTEVEMRHMENEIHRLSERVRVLEKLVRCEDCSLLKQMVNLQVQLKL